MSRWMALAALLLMVSGIAAATPAQAQSGERCFSQTQYCINGRIRTFWEQSGGLPIIGYPITRQSSQPAENGVFELQYFERYRLEVHPENAQPYDVLLGRLGAEILQRQGRDWMTFPKAGVNDGDAETCRFFAETQHTVCGRFWEVYRQYGVELGEPGITFNESLHLFGLPLSQPMTERLSDGREYTVQWFERARLEMHPENTYPYDVLLGRLSAELVETLRNSGAD